MNKWWLLLPFVLVFIGCSDKIPSEGISELQKRIDIISKKVEAGQGLKAKKGIEDIQSSINNLEKKLDELNKELKETNKRLDELDKRYTSLLNKFQQ